MVYFTNTIFYVDNASTDRLWTYMVLGGEIKRDPEIGKTATQPEPAQTANLSISGSHLISSLCRSEIIKTTQCLQQFYREKVYNKYVVQT